MRRVYIGLLVLAVFFFLSPLVLWASDLSLEKDLQKSLERSRVVIDGLKEKLREGQPIGFEIAELKNLSEDIKASHLLLQEQFRLREEEIRLVGVKALERYRVMAEGFSRALREYLSLMESLPLEGRLSLSFLDRLKVLLDQILPRKKRPIFGSLPYKNLKYPAREPNTEPPIKPAYKGGDKAIRSEDLKSTLEAPISHEIAALAQSLGWNPVSIYEWVKNNIETDWYWGCMKGAEETLRQRGGNDCDQATLLTALFRASGFPSRYVRGVVEFFPDVEKAKNLTGIEDPLKIAEFFQKAGIPFKPVFSGGGISNFQIEHIWVESQIPYANYRGAIIDEHGKAWLGLDTSLKVTGYTYSTPIEEAISGLVSSLKDEYLGGLQSQTPLEYIKAKLEAYIGQKYPGKTYNDLLRTRALIPEVMNILPASLQFQQVRITHEYSEIPDELKHKIKFTALDKNGKELFSITFDALQLPNQGLTLSYEPETIEDQEIINSYGGLSNTPAYLVRLRPVLEVNGERMVVGKDGLPMGEDLGMVVEFISPSGVEKASNVHIVGNLCLIGIVSQKPSPLVGEGGGEGDKDAEQILYEEAIHYIGRWNQAEEELASLLHLAMARPIPTMITLGGVIDVTYLLDTPHGFDWKGVYVDADLRTIETVASGFIPDGRHKTFMQLSSLQGSILENRIFEDDFGVESISTAKLFGLANNTLIPILTIDKSNIFSILPSLPFDEGIKEDITNSVNQNFTVRIPQSEIPYEDWRGIGYIVENLETGESGYMLSGMIAGGMTAWGIDKWPEYYLERLENPDSEPPNYDPASAKYIQKIAKTDLQKGKVGDKLLQPLQVIVFDQMRKPVQGVEVTFNIKAGGGKFDDGSLLKKVKTDGKGIASVWLILGQKTADNPTYWWETGYTYSQQIGENLVDASLASGTRIPKPFTAYGFPKEPSQIKKTYGDGRWDFILSFSGFVSVQIEDIYGNPISNLPVGFSILPAIDTSGCGNPNLDLRQAVLFKKTDPCLYDSPTLGECATESSSIEEKTGTGGAAVQIILGSIPAGKYPIRATSGSLSTTFYHYTFPFGNCSGTEDPENYFLIEYVYPADPYGNNINAGKVGASIPLRARISFQREKETEKEFTFTCSGETILCKKVIGAREYYIDTSFKTAWVTFDDRTGAPVDRGIYKMDYTLKSGINDIQVNGSASIDRRRTIVCPSCVTSTETLSRSDSTIIRVYGVDVKVDPPPAILLDENGYATRDYAVRYTVVPAEYQALTAFVMILKNGEPVASIPAELKGGGDATISSGFWFDIKSIYEVEVVLNGGTGVEIKSDRIPPPLITKDSPETLFRLDRAYVLSQFDTSLGVLLSEYTDSYEVFTFDLSKPSTASLKILDLELSEKATIISDTSLPAGQYKFVIDYRTIFNAGFDPIFSPKFLLELDVKEKGANQAQRSFYQGKIAERTQGKMLGQTIVHDVLIQDGSLNLSRQDLAIKGRGPELSFIRSYNNQSSGRGRRPLGEGWGHSLDMRLFPISSVESGSESVPAWVNSLRSKFYTSEDEPKTPEGWTVVSVNGTTFKKHSGLWYPERGRHGTLEETGNGFLYTSKDGTRYRYDYPWFKEAWIRAIEDRNGNIMTFHYDSRRRLEEVVDSVDRKLTFTYEDKPTVLGVDPSRLVKVNGPDGIELSFTYNEKGNLESAKRETRVETYTYVEEIASGDYNLIKVTDANDHSFAYEYHGPFEVDPNLKNFIKVLKSQDVVKKVTYPDGNSALFKYDVKTDNKRVVTDLRGNDTIYTLNYFGNPKKIEEPGGRTTEMTWSIDEGLNDNVMTSKTDARGNKTRYEYDSKGNIVRETDPYDNTIINTWNPKYSLPENRTDRNGIRQSWQYDGNGNLLTSFDGDGNKTEYTYYPTGERRTMTDPRENTTSYTYDQWGNPDKITEPEASVTDYDYDVRGRRIRVTDPRGNKTEYTYDPLDYPDKIIHPEITAYSMPAGSTTIQDFDYDPVGNLLRETNRVGLTLTYMYTPRNQVKTVTRSIGGVKTFDYDPNGNLLSETDWKGKAATHTYDPLNQRIATNNRLGYTMRMAYDLSGNLTSVTDYEDRTTTYEYDKLNRLTDIWQPPLEGNDKGHVVNTYYKEADPKTNLKSETDQEGHTTAYEYNGRYLRTNRTNALGDLYTWEYDASGNLTKETNEDGYFTQYEYDKQNRRTAMIQPGDIRTSYQYDAHGNRTYLTNPLGKTIETAYDEWNRSYLVKDPDGYVKTTEYDGEGKEVRIIDGNGNSRSWVRDQRGLVLTATDGEGYITRYTYDPNGNVETVTDAKNTITKTTHDAEDRKLTATEAFGTSAARRSEILSYDRVGNPLEVKDFNSNIRRTEYNVLNLVSKVYDPAPFDTQFTETIYYKTGRIKTNKNRRGHTTKYEYDELNREKKVTDPLSQTVETTYDRVGNVKTKKDKRGIVTENFYDELSRLVRVVKAGILIVTNEYDGAGNLRFVTDANGNRTENRYNNRNLLEITFYPVSTSVKRTYDGVSNLLTVTDEEGKVTTYTYDKENRQTSVELAGEKTVKTYDEVGNLVSITRPKGNRRSMVYDGLKRPTSVTDDPEGMNLITRYKYDPNGNLRYQYDPKGYYIEFTYDSLNRKTQHIQYKGTGNLITRYTSYGPEGNLKEMIDPKGQTFTYEYDGLNRQTDAFYPSVLTPYLTITKIHTNYDPNNNVLSKTEAKTLSDNSSLTDTTVNTYDNFDRLKTSTQRGLTITYGYDNNGNRTVVSTPSGTTTYAYDSRNRLTTPTANGLVTTYTYHLDGKKDTITYPNNTNVKYTYYPTNRVETVTHKAGGSVISSYAYQYDKNGNRTLQTELQNGLTETTTYNYDSLDRLKDFIVTDGSNITLTEYTFDSYNRKTEKVTENTILVKSRAYSYDETNWLTRIDDDKTPKIITYTYDNNGNMTGKSDSSLPNDDATFVYDSRNQLVQFTRGPPGNEIILGQYDYNSAGLRVRHRLSERGDVDYYYDDDAVIEEHNAADNSLLAHYRYADRLLSLDTGLDTQYYHHDALGSTVNLTNPTGATQVSYILDPWGHIRRQTGFSLNRHIFTSQEHDENTGLIYFGARYYDPDIARFITQDSYLGESNIPPSLNRYLYAYSNPTVYVDLMGYVSEEFVKQLKEGEGLYWSPKVVEFVQKRLGIQVSPEKLAELATAETMASSLGSIIIETATGLYEFGKGTLIKGGEISKFFERHETFARKIHNEISHGRRISNPELLSDPEFQKAFADYATINPSAISIQFEIPSKGLLGGLETEEGRKGLKTWFAKEFDFTDREVSDFERAKRGWNLILALWTVGEAAKPLEAGVRSLGKTGSVAREVEKLTGKGLGDIATSPWLADPRSGVRSHIEMFREGGSFLIPESAYKRLIKGENLIGRPDGQFITTKSAMDKLMAETGGNLTAINNRLGTRWNEQLYRVDIDNPLLHNARLPTGLEKGADPDLFRWGGYTSGGMPEAIINPVPKGQFSATPLFKK